MEHSGGDDISPTQQRIPRLNFKKSRNGCQRCKARRVKCDEVRPACGNCSRHMAACVYNDPVPSSTRPPEPGRMATAAGYVRQMGDRTRRHFSMVSSTGPDNDTSPESVSTTSDPNELDVFGIPESKARRLLELRLLQTFLNHIAQPYPQPQGGDIDRVWREDVPKMALEHDNLLHTLFCVAATYMLRDDPSNTRLRAARHSYWGMALREQRNEVARLTNQNAEPVAFASMMMVVNQLASLEERSLDPYTPPMEYLEMGRGAGSVFGIALAAADQHAKVLTLVKRTEPPVDTAEPTFTEENRQIFPLLLTRIADSPLDSSSSAASSPSSPTDLDDPDTHEVYANTVAYLGSIQRAVAADEPIHAICRRLGVFPLLIPGRFIDLVRECRPRALVVLAHYFALNTNVDSVWWARNLAREIRPICAVLPPRWRPLMDWPLAMAAGYEIRARTRARAA